MCTIDPFTLQEEVDRLLVDSLKSDIVRRIERDALEAREEARAGRFGLCISCNGESFASVIFFDLRGC